MISFHFLVCFYYFETTISSLISCCPCKRSKLFVLVSLEHQRRSFWCLGSFSLGWSSICPNWHHRKRFQSLCWRQCSCNHRLDQIVDRGVRTSLDLVCVARLRRWCGTGRTFGRTIFYL